MLTCTGCTTLALERHTLTQTASPTDIRYQEVLDNLAMVARNQYALPAYSSIFAGTAQITDTAQFVSTTTLGPGAAAEAINPSYTRAVLGNWTLDPINAPEKLEVMRCACRWIIYGKDFACKDGLSLLFSPEQVIEANKLPGNPCINEEQLKGRHFGVFDKMINLPQDWLCKGLLCDVPPNACYKARSGDMWVWVMPNGMKGLADFNLILQDIARVDINSPTLLVIKDTPSDFLFPTTTKRPLCCQANPLCPEAALFPKDPKDPNDSKRASIIIAQVSVDRCGNLKPDKPYYPLRLENLGSDPSLRSQISAAAGVLK